MKKKFVQAYIDIAHRFSRLSTARRLQVGAIIVKDDRIISIGYNGMPAGWENDCEDKEWMNTDSGGWLDQNEIEKLYPLSDDQGHRYRLRTKPEVLHAEMNALMKLAKSTESGDQASIFITHAPCIDCAKGIYQSGIKQVFYTDEYRSNEGLTFLRRCEIRVEKIDKEEQ